MYTRILSFTLLLLTIDCDAFGGNPFFMPGDAYFFSEMNSTEFRDATSDGLHLHYSLSGDVYFCGYAGFSELRITGEKAQLLGNRLTEFHRRYRDTYATTQVVYPDGRISLERDLCVLIYNRDCNFDRQRLGIKYNESWNDLPPESVSDQSRFMGGLGGPPRPLPVRSYRALVESSDAIVEDWRNGKRYAGLSVNVPENIGWALAGPKIETPVTIDAEKIKVIVYRNEKQAIKRLFGKKEWATFHEITVEGDQGWRYSKGELTATEGVFGRETKTVDDTK